MEPINKKEKAEAQATSPGELIPIAGNVVSSIPWKLFIILFFVFILVTSDVFVRYVLAKCPGTVEGNNPTTIGTFVQGGVLVGIGIISSLLIDNRIL